MPLEPLAVARTGLVTSVGCSAPTSCAAIRAGVTNPTESHFVDFENELIVGHSVSLDQPWRGRVRCVKMAARAVAECLSGIRVDNWTDVPLIACVAERSRPGRLPGLEESLLSELQQELQLRFAGSSSRVVANGRVSVAVALQQARKLLYSQHAPYVVIVAVDGFLSWPTLSAYCSEDRILTARNSNGFMPGEAAGALLVSRPAGRGDLLCVGLGFGMERAHIGSEEPLRGDGLTHAIQDALGDAGLQMHDMDFRITDVSGEQYYFKEAQLALSRTLRRTKEQFDIWHPAECIGETGAAAGAAVVAVANAAVRKSYALGPRILAHMANDAGERAAIVLQLEGA